MSWDLTTATSDLRTLLSDGPTDRLRYRKPCFGKQNTSNKVFKTFEFRRLTDFTTATAPLGVFVNGTQAAISADNVAVGEFTFTTVTPAITDTVEATYYAEWFLDSEIQNFVKNAALFLASTTDVTAVTDGLRPSALKYAAADAYQKLAVRWTERISETYRREDAMDPKTKEVVDTYIKTASQFRKEAIQLRNEFYTRQGQALQPLFGNNLGKVLDVPPRR